MANSGASIFEYYRDIIPEQENWTAVFSQPLPRCFWANTLKTTPLQLKKLLEADGFSLQPVAWDPTAFRTLQTDVGKQWHYSAGLLQIQEEVSMLPVHFLDPKPGERVLDLCAAPGNKTAQIAIRLNNTGTLIANDKNFQRMRAFGQISKRLGLLNVSTTVYDGRNYPRLLNYFDKVLVDAPCSGEGVFRKGKGRDIVPNKKNSLRLQRIQIDLLKKAIQLCRPGGRIVYSTCTFSPLENEAVLDAILKTHDNIQLKPVRLDHFQLTPAITQWQGKTFDDGVVNAGRAWPHLNNSGGFFVAVLEKQGELIEVDDSLPSKSIASDKDQLQAIIGEQVERFGFPDTLFESYVYNDDNYRGIYCVNADNQPPSELKIDATGLFFIKTAINYPKLSTAAAMLFGKSATKNKIELSASQRDLYFNKQDFELSTEQITSCRKTGYVLCFYLGYPIGVGLYFEANEDRPPMLRSLFPKYLR